MFEREDGELDMKQVDALHQKLMQESALYRTASELKLAGLMCHLQLKEVEKQMARSANG